MFATLKHFPGHGDTDVDSHLGLPVIAHPRERLDALELPPFRSGLHAGASGVMVAHIELPALDQAPGPATFSRAVVTGLLRGSMQFSGLIFSDAMRMDVISQLASPGEAAVKAVQAGIDVILDSPDTTGAVHALKAAVESGQIPRAQIDASVRRVLEAKARLGLHRTRQVSLDALVATVGGRTHDAAAQEVSGRAVTLLKDEPGRVPLQLRPAARVLYLSVLDYPANWRTGAPSRTMIPELRARWPGVEAVEVSDRSSANELSLVEAMAPRFDAVIAGIFVRAASASGRLDLAPPVVRLLQTLARRAAAQSQPLVGVFFGSPYAALSTPDLPAMILTYDFSDHAERAAVRALAGEAAISGRLPVSLTGQFPIGHGLMRSGATGTSGVP
jgi:beta-N-acetylhexosaminidase